MHGLTSFATVGGFSTVDISRDPGLQNGARACGTINTDPERDTSAILARGIGDGKGTDNGIEGSLEETG